MNQERQVFWLWLFVVVMMGIACGMSCDAKGLFMTDYTELEIKIKEQTEKDVLLETEDGDWWVPWSCVEENGEDFYDGYEGPMYVADWFVEKRG